MNARRAFAAYVRERRLALGLTLREFCRRYEFDVAHMSRIERGLSAPTQTPDFLERYARALGCAPQSHEWQTFHDLAQVAAGRIPERILADEEVAGKLPLVFRALTERGPLTEEKLLDLAERVRRA